MTVVEYLPALGAGMDAEIAKGFQKIITKQGLKIKTNTKVVNGSVENGKVKLQVESSKGGKPETVELFVTHNPARS